MHKYRVSLKSSSPSPEAMYMEEIEKFQVSYKAMDNPFTEFPASWSPDVTSDMEAMEKVQVSYKAVDNPFTDKRLWPLDTVDAEAMEDSLVSLEAMDNLPGEEPGSWSLESIDMEMEATEKLEVSPKAVDKPVGEEPASGSLQSIELSTEPTVIIPWPEPVGTIHAWSEKDGVSRRHVRNLSRKTLAFVAEVEEMRNPAKDSCEDTLLLLLEDLCDETTRSLNWTVQRIKHLFPSPDSEYRDGWETACRGLRQLQEGLSTIADAEKLLCRPINRNSGALRDEHTFH